MKRYRSLTTAMAAMLAAGAIGLAAPTLSQAADQQNGKDDAAEYSRLAGAKISLSQAIDAAEKKFGGKAVNAALDNEQASAAFEVELMSDKGSQTVAVDGLSGEATITPDQQDNGGSDVE
ncbi:PepSY domain-containing protein [Rhizobium sp. 2MFCol3.1]|uniref:PepSY domain-containing protein n=1 Tax=Rhizobium sp. 2MFCol3.1 TaxID=1246459 RepID=UPI000380B4DC|nr:PepSY domain-containing protein [Rhizobium sp. 2MFCol3.1]